jgi:hypothetical protein
MTAQAGEPRTPRMDVRYPIRCGSIDDGEMTQLTQETSAADFAVMHNAAFLHRCGRV